MAAFRAGAGSGLSHRSQKRKPLHALDRPGALKVVLHYLAFVAIGNLLWETAQLPLYTVWVHGSMRDLTIAVLHCWAGDLMIATSCLLTALLLVARGWPASSRKRVALLTVALGLGYAVYSEWVNVVVRHSWA
jgi:hypothetical protein